MKKKTNWDNIQAYSGLKEPLLDHYLFKEGGLREEEEEKYFLACQALFDLVEQG